MTDNNSGAFARILQAIRGAGGHVGLFPHGLAVPSVIAGFSSELGPVSGAAPGAKILPIRVPSAAWADRRFAINCWIHRCP